MFQSDCLTKLNTWLADWLAGTPRRRKSRNLPHATAEALEQRQLLVADPTGLWNLTADGGVGTGTANLNLEGDRLHFAGAFPSFGLNSFEIDGTSTAANPDKFKGGDKLVLFNSNIRVKVKFQLEFTSDTTFTAITRSKVKKEGRFTHELTGTKVIV